MNIKRGGHSCIIVDHISTMYVFGGRSSYYGTHLNSTEMVLLNEMGLFTNDWSILNATLSNGLYDTVAVNPDLDRNVVYIIGPKVDILNVVTNEIMTGLNPGLGGLVAAIYANKRIYVFGGCGSDSKTWHYSDLIDSSAPTISPTFSPTLSPSSSPTYNPIKYPTHSPTIPPTTHPTYTHGEGGMDVNFVSKYLNEMVLLMLLSVYVLVSLFAKLIAIKTKNDEIKLSNIVGFGFQTFDYVSDILTAFNVFNEYFIIWLLLLLFSTIPPLINIYQTQKTIKKWIINYNNNGHANNNLDEWILSNIFIFYVLCLICGDGYHTVRFCSSHLFDMNLFKLNITLKQEKELQTNLTLLSSLLQHIPQFILEVIILCLHDSISIIATIALIANTISICLTFCAYFTKKAVLNKKIVHVPLLKQYDELADNEIDTELGSLSGN
eukprot:151303_1